MYLTFNDIKGGYIKISDSANVNYEEFKVVMISNNINAAKTPFETLIYDYPSKYSQFKKIKFSKGEKVYTITTVGGFHGSKPLPSDKIRFSLIEIPRLKLRAWINEDELENRFN